MMRGARPGLLNLYKDFGERVLFVSVYVREAHRAYGPLPHAIYVIDRTEHVAFRALWAGQEGLLRDKLEDLIRREAAGEDPVSLGQQENLLIPLLHGAAEFDYAVARGGEKSTEDFRREMGLVMYGLQKLMSKMEPIINPRNTPVT
jgi:hypothetical protein